MSQLDLIIVLVFLVGMFVLGFALKGQNRNAKEMFSAGGQSPWWMAGLSAFMTMFSAGTFVVWGGIAFKHGAVAISISLCYGIAAFIAGRTIAAKWHRSGFSTAAEFIECRYGRKALNFYTWTMLLYKLLTLGVSLYSLGVIVTAMAPLAENNPLQDPQTGNLSLVWALILFGGCVVVYTAMGGLWAVLLTDVVQFVVLMVAVAIVVPLLLVHPDVGGIMNFLERAPEGFLHPTGGGYGWFFLLAWIGIHYFVLGGEWAFVQRYTCVRTGRDAKKGAYLFGVLYLVSPFLWMLPPMIYRTMDPTARAEDAYILACAAVLPSGLMGLMIAAMISATASMVSSQLNIFAGVLTHDFYKAMFRPHLSQHAEVNVGRLITAIVGGAVVALALLVPVMGGAEQVIVSVTSLLIPPLLIPTVWGIFSKKISTGALWATIVLCFSCGAFLKFGLAETSPLSIGSLAPLAEWARANARNLELVVGLILPICLLLMIELRSRQVAPGWRRVQAFAERDQVSLETDRSSVVYPIRVFAVCLSVVGLLLLLLAAFQAGYRIVEIAFGLPLFVMGFLVWRAAARNGTHVSP